MDPQPEALPDQAHPAHGSLQRAFARAERDHRVARRREEWSGQPHRRRGLRHGPHGHGAERSRHPGLPGEGLGPPLADLRPVQPESPDDVPHEVRTAAIGLYQRHRPRRPRQLQHEARHSGSAANVEHRGGRLRDNHQEQERIQDQVDDLLRHRPVSREAAHPAPSSQLFEEDPCSRLEPGVDPDAQRFDARFEQQPRFRHGVVADPPDRAGELMMLTNEKTRCFL